MVFIARSQPIKPATDDEQTAEQSGIRASLLKQKCPRVRRSFGEIFDIRVVEVNIYHG